jgi:hypothetical protein
MRRLSPILALLLAATGQAAAQSLTQTRFEESAALYTGSWMQSTYARHSGSAALVSEEAGARASFTFRGTAVRWISYRAPDSGIARVHLDGNYKALVDLYSPTEDVQPVAFEISGLAPDEHTLTVEVLGSRNEQSGAYWVTVDAFDAELSPLLHRSEQDDSAASYTGTWYPFAYSGHSGGTAVSALEAGARATFTFNGAGVRWIAYRDEWSGIANVYVDGELKAILDTYASPAEAQATMFSIGGLSPGSHTLAIEAAGAAGPLSGGTGVTVDAFDVEAAPPPVTFTRLEQDDPAVTYVGIWQTREGTEHSGGRLSYANYLGAIAHVDFFGTGVRWIGYGNHATGIARVYLDGNLVGVVDTFASPPRAQTAWFLVGGLPEGSHRLTIEVTEAKNPLSAGTSIALDAFDVTP